MFPLSYSNMAPSYYKLAELDFIFYNLEHTFYSKRIKLDKTKITFALSNTGEKFHKNFYELAKEKEELTWESFKQKCKMESMSHHIRNFYLLTEQQRNEPNSEFLFRLHQRIIHVDIPWHKILTHCMKVASKSAYKILLICIDSDDVLNFAEKSRIEEIENERRSNNRKEAQKRISKRETRFQKSPKEKSVNHIKQETTGKHEQKDCIKIDDIEVDVIKDTGSNINVITQELVYQHSLPSYAIEEISVKNIFGSTYKLNKTTCFTYQMDNLWRTDNFYIAPSTECQVIISKNTLKNHYENLKIFNKYEQKFETTLGNEVVGCIKDQVATIPTEQGKKVHMAGKQLDRNTLDRIEKTLPEMLNKKFIQPSESTWLNPIRPVEKSNNRIRFTLNMIFLNKLVEQENYSIPKI